MVTALLASLPAVEGVTSHDQFAPVLGSIPTVRIRVDRPDNHSSKLPALYWIHGGGYLMENRAKRPTPEAAGQENQLRGSIESRKVSPGHARAMSEFL